VEKKAMATRVKSAERTSHIIFCQKLEALYIEEQSQSEKGR
jgi:hypothetical protein